MIRTGFARKAPAAEKKPMKGSRTRKCAAKGCMARVVPGEDARVTWCSDDCGVTVALQAGAARKAKVAQAERAKDKARKRELSTPAELAAPVRKLAQRYAVLRDRDYGCISCDKGPHWHGVWHGSHFKSVGSSSALQFNLWNINKACDQCNFFLAGNIGPYETRLRQKLGDDKVDWLKNHPRTREYTPEYLDRLARILRKRIRRLEKRLGIN